MQKLMNKDENILVLNTENYDNDNDNDNNNNLKNSNSNLMNIDSPVHTMKNSEIDKHDSNINIRISNNSHPKIIHEKISTRWNSYQSFGLSVFAESMVEIN